MTDHYEKRDRTARWLLVYAGLVTLAWATVESFKPVEMTIRLAFGSVIGACVAISRSLWTTANEGTPSKTERHGRLESGGYTVTQQDRSLPE